MKRNLLLCGLAIVAIAAAFATGRFLAPSKTVEVSSRKDQAEIRALTEQLETAKRHTVKETVTTFGPTGKPATKTVREDTHVDRTTDTRTDVHATKTVEVIKRVEVTRAAPMNRLGVLAEVGPDLRVSVGPEFQRRLIGPLIGSVHVLIAPPTSVKPTEVRAGIGLHWEF